MSAIEDAELFVATAPRSPAPRTFAEPDWQGDPDYQGDLAEADIDRVVGELQAAIEAGRIAGGLDAYRARRAAFDLQSIRSQIARERSSAAAGLGPRRLSAALSRADRLRACLTAMDLQVG